MRPERAELEQGVQTIEREEPKWSASEVEQELGRRFPVAYGTWKDGLPNRRSRLRQVQRWRLGARGRDQTKGPRHLFPYVWPVGERQRRELEPNFPVSPVISTGTWRVFLYNCSPEVIRDVRVYLDGRELDYAPSLLEGRFAEIHWQKVEAIKAALLSEGGNRISDHELSVEFVIARGTRQARVVGQLTLDAGQGWLQFDGRDGRCRELE